MGGIAGALFANFIVGSAADELSAYLRDYLTLARAGDIHVEFWAMLWEPARFLLGTILLGVTALGVVGIPALFGVRGFLFAFSVAGVCRVFGPMGIAPALFLFGLPAFLWAPILFVAGVQSLGTSYTLLRRALGDRLPLPFDTGYWGRLALCGLLLLLCVALEYTALPILLRLAAQFVL